MLALEAIHSFQYIYRDLKPGALTFFSIIGHRLVELRIVSRADWYGNPENILIGVDGYIRLCDFGMVHYLENENSKTDELCGTADYFAPEMHRGGGYNFSVDYWTLGCMIYDLT